MAGTSHRRCRRLFNGKRLCFEALEDRSLLTAAFTVNLYKDVGGTPGDLIANDTVHMGDKFFAEITARDYDPRDKGLARVALNIAWDTNALQEIDSPFDPSKLITADLPLFQSGALLTGTIQDLGGSGFTGMAGRLIGKLAPERFALLHFEAIAPTESSLFSLSQGASSIVTHPTATLKSSQIRFEAQTITVLASPATLPNSDTHSVVPIADNSSHVAPVGPVIPAVVAAPPAAHANTSASAKLGLYANLYRDAGGVPGDLITSEVAVGDNFYVEIAAQDLRAVPQGIGGLSVDVSWEPAVFAEIDRSFDPIHSSALVTPSLPLFRGGTLDSARGEIVDLGGASLRSTGSGEPIGAEGAQRFSLLQFRAIAPADQASFALQLGQSGAGLISAAPNQLFRLDVQSRTIPVVDTRQPSLIAITNSTGPDPTAIQFTTELNGALVPLVRPAYPDRKQYLDVANTGSSPLTISEIQINVSSVTVDRPLTADVADDVVLGPHASRRIGLTYAPSSDSPHAQPFQVAGGLVIVSDAANAPRIEVTLAGAATFNADINYDGRVNIGDLVILDDHMGQNSGKSDFDAWADPNGDGRIDLGDLGTLNASYGAALAAIPTLLRPAAAAQQAASPRTAEQAASGVASSAVADIARGLAAVTGSHSPLLADAHDQAVYALVSDGFESINKKTKRSNLYG